MARIWAHVDAVEQHINQLTEFLARIRIEVDTAREAIEHPPKRAEAAENVDRRRSRQREGGGGGRVILRAEGAGRLE